jgi:hypothetical protein
MALVTNTVTPTVRTTPFTGLSETVREASGIARAEEVHSAYGTWPATGAGDERSISFLWSLNPDYGYVLMDFTAAFIHSSNYNSMSAVGAMEIATNTGPGAADTERQHYALTNHPGRSSPSGTTNIGDISETYYNRQAPITGDNSIMIFEMPIKPTGLLYPFPGVDDVSLVAMFGEERTNMPAFAYRMYCRFLQYDITQGYNYVVQSPLLTR